MRYLRTIKSLIGNGFAVRGVKVRVNGDNPHDGEVSHVTDDKVYLMDWRESFVAYDPSDLIVYES